MELIDISKGQFNDMGEGEEVFIVMLTAPWCGGCKSVKPMLEDYNGDSGNHLIHQYDIEQDEKELAKELGVMSLPTLLVYKNGEEVERGVATNGVLQVLDKIKSSY